MPTVRLTWTDPNSGFRQEDEVRVYRAAAPFDAGTLPAVLATLAADTVTYDDVTAVDGNSYYYAVAAVKGGTLAISFTGEVAVGAAYVPVAEPAPNAAKEAEYLAAAEYTHDWSNLTGWTVSNMQVSGNRLYSNGSGTNPSACFYPFAVAAGESARITCEIVRFAGVNRSTYVGFETVGGTILAGLPNFCGIGVDGSDALAAYVGANFTGVTTGNRPIRSRSGGGTYTVTVSADADYVSMVVRLANGTDEAALTIPRSALPGGGAIAGIMCWNTDTRGLTGSYTKGIGVRKSLTPFRTKTVTGSVIEGTSGQVIHRNTPTNLWRIHLPKSMDGETAHPICLYTHQHNATRNIIWSDKRARPVLNALDAAGYIVISCDDQVGRWGNQESLDNYTDAVQWVRDNFFAGPLVVLAASMGGCAAWNMVLRREVHVRAIAALSAVCDIPPMYYGSFVTTLNSAYGVANLPALEAAIVGYNPVEGDMVEFTGKAVKFWVATGTSDATVPEADHALVLQALIAPFAVESTVVESGSGHLNISQFDTTAIVALFDTYT